MSDTRFSSIVGMQVTSCAKYANNDLFGTKVGDQWEWVTYGEVAKKIDAMRGFLATLGVGKDDRVAVVSNNRVEWAVGAYAAFGLGAWYVPTYEVTLPREWKFILENSGAKVAFAATKEIYEHLHGFIGEVPSLERVICFELDASHEDSYVQALKVGAENPAPVEEPSSDDTALILYTSGTTGTPKGVMLTHGNITSNVNAVHQVFPMSEADRSLSFLPWAHSFGQTCELHCLVSMGAAIGIAESVPKLIENLGEVKPTILFSVPRVFNRIYDVLQKRIEEDSAVKRFLFNKGLSVARQRRALEEQNKSSAWLNAQYKFFDSVVFSKVRERFGGNLRYAFSGGAALSKEVAEFIDDMNILVYEGYGLTETSPIATANYPGPNNRKIGTIGKEIPGVTIYICDEEQNVLPDGQEGEIVVVGPNVMAGYLNLKEATDEVIVQVEGKRAFRTGDMGCRGNDGFIRITGRFKEQYKLENGKYVSPAPLEEKLQLSGYIAQAMLYGFNKPHNVAVIVPDFESVAKWAKQNGIADTSPKALAANKQVEALILEEIKKYSDDFKGYERPKQVLLLSEEFSPENDMLTPSLKLKRRNVIKEYESQIDDLYA